MLPHPMLHLIFAALAVVLPLDGTCLEPRDIDPARALAEPSAIVFHAERGTLFAVGDEGDIAELRPDGERVAAKRLGKLDLEGITVGPGGKLYLAVEAPPEVIVVDPATLAIERRHRLDTRVDGRAALWLKAGGGMEGICYAPDLDAFFAVNQLEPARLVELDVPRSGKGDARVKRIVAELSDTVRCASDIMWDGRGERFLVTSSSFDEEARPGKLWEVDLEGAPGKARRLPGIWQEGFCLDADGNAYVAQDSGGILRVDPYRGDEEAAK